MNSLRELEKQREERAAAQSLKWQSQKPSYTHGRSSPEKWAGGEFVAQPVRRPAEQPKKEETRPSAPAVKPVEEKGYHDERVVPLARELEILPPRHVERSPEAPENKKEAEVTRREPVTEQQNESGRQTSEKKKALEEDWREHPKEQPQPSNQLPKTSYPPSECIRVRLPKNEKQCKAIETFVPTLPGYRNHKVFGVDLMVWFRAVGAATSALLVLQNPPWSIHQCDYPRPRAEGEILQDTPAVDKGHWPSLKDTTEEKEISNRARQLQEIYVLICLFMEGEFEEISNGIMVCNGFHFFLLVDCN